MQKKKIPMRQCVGCMEMKQKSELVRIVRSPEGEISLDTTGKKNGRGSYICKNADCFKAALKKKCFYRAFGVNVPDEVAEEIEKEINREG